MVYTEKEIELTLKLYSIAKVKKHDYKYQLSRIENNDDLLKNEFFYYDHIIKTVERWITYLERDEEELIKLRFFENYTSDYVSILLGYSSHSSIVKNCKRVIRKIKQKEIR